MKKKTPPTPGLDIMNRLEFMGITLNELSKDTGIDPVKVRLIVAGYYPIDEPIDRTLSKYFDTEVGYWKELYDYSQIIPQPKYLHTFPVVIGIVFVVLLAFVIIFSRC